MQIRFFRSIQQAALTLGVLAVISSVRAQSASTDPVGAIVIPLLGQSDTPFSIPVHRPVALEAKVLSVATNVFTLQAPAALTASQFVYVAGTQPNTYYVQFLSGAREGMYYSVTANDAVSLTVNLNGDTGASTAVQPGDIVQVIPYWTLGTLFPAGVGVHATASLLGTPQTEILFPPANVAGTNHSAAQVYFYFSGNQNTAASWRLFGSSGSANDAILYPDIYYVARHNVAGDTALVLTGGVPMSGYATVLSTLQSNVPQDIAVAVSVPTPVTLAQSQLFESGAFTASASSFNIQDELLVFNSSAIAQNKSAAAEYYYLNGPSGTGWRQFGVAGDASNSLIFQPGSGYIIRKKATGTPTNFYWSFVPPYLTQ